MAETYRTIRETNDLEKHGNEYRNTAYRRKTRAGAARRRMIRSSAIFIITVIAAVVCFTLSKSIPSIKEARLKYISLKSGAFDEITGKVKVPVDISDPVTYDIDSPSNAEPPSGAEIPSAAESSADTESISDEDLPSDTDLPFSDVSPSDTESTSDNDTSSGAKKTSRDGFTDVVFSNELILVNSEYTIDENFNADLSSAYKIVPLSTSTIQINSTVLDAVAELFKDARKNGFGDFFVNSGYRSYQKQKELYDEAEDKSFVQEPGASEHQTGYAVDIAYTGLTGEAFGKSPQGKWLMANAHKYGFILRYPEGKTDITKISYEPWHYRYVGLPHSYFCYEKDMCLEEYISFLANGGSYTISIDKTKYTVYYATENDGFIDVPADKRCKVLPDNTGGYVVVVMG